MDTAAVRSGGTGIMGDGGIGCVCGITGIGCTSGIGRIDGCWLTVCGIVTIGIPDWREPADEKWAGFPTVSRLMRSGYHAITMNGTP